MLKDQSFGPTLNLLLFCSVVRPQKLRMFKVSVRHFFCKVSSHWTITKADRISESSTCFTQTFKKYVIKHYSKWNSVHSSAKNLCNVRYMLRTWKSVTAGEEYLDTNYLILRAQI